MTKGKKTIFKFYLSIYGVQLSHLKEIGNNNKGNFRKKSTLEEKEIRRN